MSIYTSENDFEYLLSCAGGETGLGRGDGWSFPRVRGEGEGEVGEEVGGWEESRSYTTTDPIQSVIRHTCNRGRGTVRCVWGRGGKGRGLLVH